MVKPASDFKALVVLTAPNFRLALILPVLLLASTSAFAQASANWRIFRNSDGLRESSAVAVTVGPRGNVVVKHGESDSISVLKGYGTTILPSPGRDNFRVYESRSGQYWSIYSEGLAVLEGRQWLRHPIAEIRAEFQLDPLRQVRQIALVPAERDHVFFLLGDALMDYDSSLRRATTIKRANQTSLVKFFDMIEASDSGLWITGLRGIAKLPGPVRRLSSETIWQEHIVPAGSDIESLQRPSEHADGDVTMTAVDSQRPSRRAIVRFGNRGWEIRRITDEPLRQAWESWDEMLWGFTVSGLLRIEANRVVKEGVWAGQYKDVATDTNGVFWLAGSEGVVRYAPAIWRSPAELREGIGLVRGLAEDAAGRLWAAATDGLLMHEKGKWNVIRWPETFEGEFGVGKSLYVLPDGRIVIAGLRPVVYSHESQQFTTVSRPAGARYRFVGQLRDGSLCAHTITSHADGNVSALERFDGAQFSKLVSLEGDSGVEVTFVLQTQAGDLWIGGPGQIALRSGQTLQTFGAEQGFTLSRPICAIDAGESRIWVGGLGAILMFNGTRWTELRSGLDRVNGFAKTRDGKTWIAAASGLHSFNGEAWVTHGADEGLTSVLAYDVVQDSGGHLWAATTQGLYRYHPEADPDPPIALDPVVENPRQVTSEDTVLLRLSGTDKWHHTMPERLLFSYRLDEGAWSPFTNLSTRAYENLGPGTHRFEVKAMDRNWNESAYAAALEFAVIVPWYREGRIIATAAAATAMVLFFAWLAVNRHLRLKRSYAEVEKIVEVRTRELEQANRELLQSHKMRALGTLAAGIAHDFNNILSIIKGSAQIIESNIEDKDKVRTRLSRIKTVVEQGTGVVKSLLGLSRVSETDFVDCDLNGIVDETVKLLGDRFLHDVHVHIKAAPSLPPVICSRELIQQMLLNLIMNAADAMSGRGDVHLRTGVTATLPRDLALLPAEAPRFVFIAVEDYGCGIEPEVLPRIFEPFFTTKALSSRRGTGLGLSMVYELAKQMGCGIAVESTVDKGSTFRIFIPVRSSKPSDAHSTA